MLQAMGPARQVLGWFFIYQTVLPYIDAGHAQIMGYWKIVSLK